MEPTDAPGGDSPAVTASAASDAFLGGRYAEAERMYDALLARDPENPDILHRAAEIKLLRGNYLDAWPLYERRILRRPILQEIAFVVGFGHRGWDGRALSGGTLLVVGEQGNGDNILAMRFLPQAARLADRLLVHLRHAGIEGLIRTAAPEAIVLAAETGLAGQRFDAFAMTMSLPALLGATPATIPQPPYIFPDPARLAHWRERLAGVLPAVGFCWRGNAKSKTDPLRSIPVERVIGPLAGIDLRPISLVRDAPAEDTARIAQLPLALRPRDLSTAMTDWAETAAIVAALDLVVTVDTGIAHLAGALGKETILLCRFPPYWPWGAEGPGTPWYPSVRVLRRRPGAGWDGSLAEMAGLLRARYGPN